MITDKSTPDEIIKSMATDRSHLEYIIKKSYGGSAKFRAASHRMMDECRKSSNGFVLGNIECYHSGFTGNNWMIYHYCKRVQSDIIHDGVGKFVYWDTEDGSIAAAVTITSGSNRMAVVYSGHFFQRYAEREQLGAVDLDVVCNFFYNNTCPVVQIDTESYKDGEYRFDIALHRGIGRGWTIGFNHENKAYKFDVRTYLESSMLNVSQREQTASLRDQRAGIERPADALCNAFFKHDEEYIKDLCDKIYRSKGMNTGFGWQVGGLLIHIIGIGICRECIKPSMNKRKLFLDLYNQYMDTICEYVHHANKKAYNYFDMIAICKLANPNFNNADALLYLLMFYIEREDSKIDYNMFVSLVEKVNQGIDIRPDIRSIYPELLQVFE